MGVTLGDLLTHQRLKPLPKREPRHVYLVSGSSSFGASVSPVL
jgi:hypothetical protein